MVGTRWPSQIRFLIAFVGLANALLTGRLRAPCSNSDGLAGYDFSHKGLWIPGYHLLGTGFSKQSCSVECSKLRDCVAFSGAFKEDGGNGGCYTYAATGGSVPSSSDRAYKKCPGSLPTLPELPEGVTQFAARKQAPAQPEAQLLTMAEGMEKQLDAVSQTIAAAHIRMRRLKSMVSGAANVLTGASRVASQTAENALANRGGLQAIARNKQFINMTFHTIDGSSTRMQKLLKRIKERAPTGGEKGKSPGQILKELQPNVTALEKTLNQLNDPATALQINGLVTNYNNFTGKITSTVKTVLSDNLRGLVDKMRGAMYNYTTALQNHKKDPCCCK
jgi:hypothetical protein